MSKKCQECDQPATCTISEIVERSLCDTHAEKFLGTKPKLIDTEPTVFSEFWSDATIAEAMQDREGYRQVAAYLLPALCLALLDNNPSVRIRTAFRLMLMGRDAQSADGALKDALQDVDPGVRKAARLARQHIESNPEPSPLL
jgi:hypothetical protein